LIHFDEESGGIVDVKPVEVKRLEEVQQSDQLDVVG
jgi:hypothetical protein